MPSLQRLDTRFRRFDCTVERSRDAAYVRAVGSLDVFHAGEFRATLEELRDERVRRVVIDLRSLTYLDRGGLAVLLQACATARREGSVLQLVPAVGAVDRLFDLTDVRQHFTLTVGTVKRS